MCDLSWKTVGFGRVWVPTAWVRVPVWVLAGFEYQQCGFESQCGFWPGLSPGRVGSSLNLRCTVSAGDHEGTAIRQENVWELGLGPTEAHGTPQTRHTGEDALLLSAHFWLAGQPRVLMHIQPQVQDRTVNLYTLLLDSEVFLLHSCILIHSCSISFFLLLTPEDLCDHQGVLFIAFTPFPLTLTNADPLSPTYS